MRSRRLDVENSIGLGRTVVAVLVLLAGWVPAIETISPLPVAAQESEETKRTEAERFLQQGTHEFRAGRFREALAAWERSLELYRAIGDRAGEGTALGNLGIAYDNLGRYERAIELFEQYATVAREIGDRAGEGRALGNLGVTYDKQGRHERAIEFFEQHLAIAREIGDRAGEGRAFGNLGVAHRNLGQLERAIGFYEKDLAISREMGDRMGEGRATGNLGVAYFSLGQFERAIDFHEQHLTIAREIGDLAGESRALGNLGILYESLGEYERAIAFYEQTATLVREMGDRAGEGTTLGNLGNAYARLRRYERAIDFYEQHLAVAREIGDRGGEGRALGNLGITYDNLGRYRRAIDFSEQHLAIAREIGDRAGEARSLYTLARGQRGAGDAIAALSAVEESLELVETLRAEVTSDDLRTSFFATVRDRYTFYIDLLLELHRQNPDAGYDARSFEASERSRARSLLDLLAESDTDLHKDIDPVLLEEEQRLRAEFEAIERERIRLGLSGGLTNAKRAELGDRLAATLQRQRDLVLEIRSNNPSYADINYPEPLSLEEVRRQVLDEDTVLLQYHLGAERSFLWVVAPDSFAVRELPPRQDIEDAVAAFRTAATHQLIRKLPREIDEKADPLTATLLGPARDAIADRRLLIVADGALHRLPFAALSVPGTDRPEDGYVPLIVRHEIVSVPSTTVLANLREQTARREPAPKTLAIFADPVFGGSDDPRTPGDANLAAGEGLADLPRAGIQIPPDRLPGTEREARAILGLVGDRGQTFAALGFDANRARAVSAELGNYRIVHFATHGFANDDEPGLSGLVLSLVDESANPTNGFLRLADIFNLRLSAELVVLSACDTGLGKTVGGEGTLGLARGFAYAGAPRLLLSLWNVDDEGTSVLMQQFYRNHLQVGSSPAAALRAAQLEMLREPAFRSPYYWAAFSFQGEWR